MLATHFLGEAGRLADRMAVLHHGHLRAFGRARRAGGRDLAGHRRRPRPRRAGRRPTTLGRARRRARGDGGRGARRRRPAAGRRPRGAAPGRRRHGRPRGPRLRAASRAARPSRTSTSPSRRRILAEEGTPPPTASALPDPGGCVVTMTTTPTRAADGRAETPPGPASAGLGGHRLVTRKDLTAVRRSKAIMLPMIFVPVVLLVLLPIGLGLIARNAPTDQVQNAAQLVAGQGPGPADPGAAGAGADRGPRARLPAVAAAARHPADGVGRARRRRLRRREGAPHAGGALLHLPITDRDLFLAKVLTRLRPGRGHHLDRAAIVYAMMSNVVAWPVMHRRVPAVRRSGW